MIRLLALVLCSLSFATATAQSEVIYHISVATYADSNGDGQGDIKGILQKMIYLQKLGVNAISLSPVHQSDFANGNYTTDLEKIDPKFGSFKEYRDLLQGLHKLRMKLYQQVDLRYVSAKHLWYTDSSKNTKSAYSGYISYGDAKNDKAFTIMDGQAVAVNLRNAKVAAYYAKALKYWADPTADGNFNDGVDGFIFTGVKDKAEDPARPGSLLKEFYAPLFAGLKKVNPDLQIVAEPTASTAAVLYKAGADRVMASPLREAILSFDKKKIKSAADSTFLKLPAGKIPVGYIESDDTPKAAGLPGMNEGKLRVSTALSFFMGGVPILNANQEFAGNPLEGTALAAAQKDKNSGWSYYNDMVRLRKMNPAFVYGTYEELANSNDNIVAFVRATEKEKSLVMINLSGEQQFTRIDDASTISVNNLQLVLGTPNSAFARGGRTVTLSPYGVQVWRILY